MSPSPTPRRIPVGDPNRQFPLPADIATKQDINRLEQLIRQQKTAPTPYQQAPQVRQIAAAAAPPFSGAKPPTMSGARPQPVMPPAGLADLKKGVDEEKDFNIGRIVVNWVKGEWSNALQLPEDTTLWRMQNMSGVPINWSDHEKASLAAQRSYSTLQPFAMDIPPIIPKQVFIQRPNAEIEATVVVIYTRSQDPRVTARLSSASIPELGRAMFPWTDDETLLAQQINMIVMPGSEDFVGGDWEVQWVSMDIENPGITGAVRIFVEHPTTAIPRAQIGLQLGSPTEFLFFPFGPGYNFSSEWQLRIFSDEAFTGSIDVGAMFAPAN